MKKLLCVLTAAVMILALAACGSSGGNTAVEDKSANSDSTSSSENATSSANNNDDEKEIMIDPVYVAIDDENVKLEILSISEKKYEGPSYEWVEYRVNCRATNKTSDCDVELSISTEDGGIGQYAVVFGNQNSTTRPGKINDTLSFSVQKNIKGNSAYDSGGVEHIASLEDLLQFNANICVSIQHHEDNEIVIYKSYYHEISLADRKK